MNCFKLCSLLIFFLKFILIFETDLFFIDFRNKNPFLQLIIFKLIVDFLLLILIKIVFFDVVDDRVWRQVLERKASFDTEPHFGRRNVVDNVLFDRNDVRSTTVQQIVAKNDVGRRSSVALNHNNTKRSQNSTHVILRP